MFQYDLARMFANSPWWVLIWWLALSLSLLLLPFALLYVPWRALRDLSRIASAVERVAQSHSHDTSLELGALPAPDLHRPERNAVREYQEQR